MRRRLDALWPPAALFLLNAYLCHELFITEYTVYMGSIEGAYIGISRYLLDHPFSFGWFPAWYTGIPFQNTYPPLLHMLVAAVAWIGQISPALSHHAVTAALYSLGPVTLYALGRSLGAGRLESLGAALLYSLYSPSSALSPTVHSWAGPSWMPARLQSLVSYGDGPHVAALTLLPLAIMALHWAMTRGGPARMCLAAIALVAVVLTNWLGAFALALAVVCYLLARSHQTGWLRTSAMTGGISLAAYILASPWIPPSTIGDIQRNAQFVGGQYPIDARQLLYWGAAAVLAFLLRLVLMRTAARLSTSFAAYFLLLTGAIVLANDWPGIQMVPQPNRYHLELEMAVCALLGFTLISAVRSRRILTGLAVVLLTVQVYNYRTLAKPLILPIDIQKTVEYQEAEWLRQNLPGGRVFLSGSTQFWLSAFTDTAQVGGGFGQGVVNQTVPIVHYGIPYVMGEGAKMAMWLRLYGANAVANSGPKGRDAYRQVWQDGAQFNGILPELWRDGDDVIFRLPQRSDSLAHVIRREHVVPRTPVNVLDLEPVNPLAAALEDPSLPIARFDWIGTDQARITAEMVPDQVLFVQVTHHPGWHASAAGRELPIARDGLGFMVLSPACTGACEVMLTYDGGTEMLLARVGSGMVMLGAVWWFVWVRRARSAEKPG